MGTSRDRTPPRHSRPRVRYQRLTAAFSACGITLVAVLGGVGLLPESESRLVAHAGTVTGAGVRAALSAASTGGGVVIADDAKLGRSDDVRRQLLLLPQSAHGMFQPLRPFSGWIVLSSEFFTTTTSPMRELL